MSTSKEPEEEWKVDLDNELQLLVARVQSEETLTAQIAHGRDFTERIAEDFEKVLAQAKSQGAREALETAIEEVKSIIGQHCGKEDCNQGQCINRHIKDDVLKEVLSILRSNIKNRYDIKNTPLYSNYPFYTHHSFPQ